MNDNDHVVSHDRRFLDSICTHIIAFEGESIAKMYIGNWSDYETMMMEKFGKDLQPHRVKYLQLIFTRNTLHFPVL